MARAAAPRKPARASRRGVASDAIFRHPTHVLASTLEDESLLLDLFSGSYFALNATGLRIWELLDGRRTVAQVAEVLRTDYDLDDAEAADCTRTFVQALHRANLVEPS